MKTTHLAGDLGETQCGIKSSDIVPEHPTCEECQRLENAKISFENPDPMADIISQKQEEGSLTKHEETGEELGPDLGGNERDWRERKR